MHGPVGFLALAGAGAVCAALAQLATPGGRNAARNSFYPTLFASYMVSYPDLQKRLCSCTGHGPIIHIHGYLTL